MGTEGIGNIVCLFASQGKTLGIKRRKKVRKKKAHGKISGNDENEASHQLRRSDTIKRPNISRHLYIFTKGDSTDNLLHFDATVYCNNHQKWFLLTELLLENQ